MVLKWAYFHIASLKSQFAFYQCAYMYNCNDIFKCLSPIILFLSPLNENLKVSPIFLAKWASSVLPLSLVVIFIAYIISTLLYLLCKKLTHLKHSHLSVFVWYCKFCAIYKRTSEVDMEVRIKNSNKHIQTTE